VQRPTSKSHTGYRGVAEQLRREIGTGRIAIGSLMPTERELYSQFRVSRTTVRRALQHLVQLGWAIPEPNRGHIASQPTAQNVSKLVAYIDHSSSIHQSLYFTLSGALAQRGFRLTHIDSEEIGTEGALELAVAQDCFGGIVWSKTSVPNVHRIQNLPHTMHWVTLMHSIPGLDADHVQPRLYEIARNAVGHLVQCGAKRLAVTGILDGFLTHHEGLAGFLAGCMDHGIQTTPSDFLFVKTSTSNFADTRNLTRRLQDADRPDGIVMLQDMWVADVAHGIAAAGLSVPDDIKIVGIGNDFPFEFETCGLSSMDFNWTAASESICDLLLRPHTTAARTPRIRQFDSSLIVRGSCGKLTSQWSALPYCPNRSFSRLVVPPVLAEHPLTDLVSKPTQQ
jgi:DNA-binding LacI/PurR family transcriptional regulator